MLLTFVSGFRCGELGLLDMGDRSMPIAGTKPTSRAGRRLGEFGCDVSSSTDIRLLFGTSKLVRPVVWGGEECGSGSGFSPNPLSSASLRSARESARRRL
jgi:hypothetical protein